MATESPVSCALLDSKKEEAANRFLLDLWLSDNLPAEHVLEQLHVLASGDVPAEVGFHFLLLQGTESLVVVVVQVQRTLDGCVEVVGVVALEGEAQTALAVFVREARCPSDRR